MNPTTTDPPSRPKPRRRRLAVLLAVLLLLPTVLALAGLLALRSDAGRAVLLERLSRSLEASSGLRLAARELRFGLLEGVVVLDAPSLAVGDAAAFFSAGEVRLELDWSDLVGEPRKVRKIALLEPVLDLRQPLPAADDAGGGGTAPALEIGAIEIRGGAVRAAVPDGDTWLRGAGATNLDLDGSFVDGRLTAALTSAHVRLERQAGSALELAAAGRLDGPLAGPWTLDDLRLVADGLELDAAATWDPGDDGPRQVTLELTAEPGQLLPELGPAGGLTASAQLDLRRFAGHLDVDAQGVPIALVEPWIGEAAAPGGTVALTARLRSDPDAAPQITGTGELSWRRGDRELVAANLTITDGRLGPEGPLLDTLVGTVRARAGGVPAELLRPWLGAELLGRLHAADTQLDLSADLEVRAAAPAAPSGRLELRWRRGAETLLVTTARTRNEMDQGLSLGFEAALLPSSPGRRRVIGRLDSPSWPEIAAGELADTRLELSLPDLDAALDEAQRLWPELFAELGLELDTPAAPLEAAVDIAGSLADPRLRLDATWQAEAAGRVALRGEFRPVARRGEARLELTGLDLALLGPELAGRADAVLAVDGSLDAWRVNLKGDLRDLRWGPEPWSVDAFHLELEGGPEGPPERLDAWRGRLRAEARGLAGSDGTTIEALALDASTDGTTLELERFTGRWNDAIFAGSATLDVAEIEGGELHRATLELEVDHPLGGVDRVELTAELDDGVLRLQRFDLEAPTGRGELRADVPLGALRGVAELDPDAWPVAVAEGVVRLDLAVPRLDLAALADDLGWAAPWTVHQASFLGRVEIDPSRPTLAEGELLVERWALTTHELEMTGTHRLEARQGEPLLFNLGDGRLELLEVGLAVDGRPLDVEATVELDPAWRVGDPPAAGIVAYEGAVRGSISTALANPFLGGGVARGPAVIEAFAAARGDELELTVTLDGPEATLVYPTPYLTRISRPRIEFTWKEGVARFRTTRALLNEGELSLAGSRTAAGDWSFTAQARRARYRFDYGLSTRLDADLRLLLPAEGRGLLDGRIEVERGLLRRDLNVDREILAALLAPTEVVAAEADPFEEIDLDLDLTTARGVRIRNNLADLHLGWSSIDVRGTLSQPVLEGRIDAEPGGFVFLFGQTARIDTAALIWNGVPDAPPELELETTSTLDDPTLTRARDQVRFDWQGPVTTEDAGPRPEQVLAEGLAGYYGAQVAERFTGGLVRVEPVLIFEETDPSTSLVISRDISSEVAFAVAVDLRDSQEQTYLIDVHDLPRLERFAFQAFTNAASNEGVTVQQVLRFGGARRPGERRLRQVRFTSQPPDDVSERALRQALGLDKGDVLDDGADFDAEVAVAEELRLRGYPGARVETHLREVDARQTDLEIGIEPGTRVVFEFTGDKPPVAWRRSITTLFRPDFSEAASIEEMRQQTVRVLREQGYLEPRVEIQASEASDGERTVTVHAGGGRKVVIDEVEWRGEAVDEEIEAFLDQRFASRAARVELAAGVAGADEWLRSSLRSLGYVEPAIASRQLGDDGRQLVVELTPGPRQVLSAVRIVGLPPAAEAEARALLPLAAGDVPRAARVAASGVRIRNDLKRRGYAEAQVKTILRPEPGDASRVELVIEVERGPQYRLEEIRFTGLDATRPGWARRLAGLEEGAFLVPQEVGRARRQFFGTRLFESVRTDIEHRDDGTAALTFELEEAPRYRVAYGLRWENSEGASAVADLTDYHLLGRGITLGLRTLVAESDRAARLYAARSGLFGRRLKLELFVEGRREEEADEFTSTTIDSFESTLQLSFPLGGATGRVYGRFRTERFSSDFFDDKLDTPVLGTQVLWDRRDDPVWTTRGFFASVDLSTSNDSLASDFDFTRLFGQAQLFRPLSWGKGWVWAQSFRLGVLGSTNEFPLSSELFFAGGEYSVRGYSTDSLGPREVLGEVVFTSGGEALLVLNQEMRFPVWRELSGLVFFDAGNVWADRDDLGLDLLTAVGIGLRAQTPIGVLRLDIGVPLDRREGDPEIKTWFGFGHSF